MDKQSKKQDKQYQIPMVVTDEVIRDFGIKQEDVTWRRIGNRKCRVVMVDGDLPFRWRRILLFHWVC